MHACPKNLKMQNTLLLVCLAATLPITHILTQSGSQLASRTVSVRVKMQDAFTITCVKAVRTRR